MASEHDRKQIDNLPNLQGIADRLESNAHYGTVNFRLQYALAMTHEDIENLDSDEIVTLQNEHKFHNTENARCYYNLLLLEELIVRQGSDIPKTYLELDRKLISSH